MYVPLLAPWVYAWLHLWLSPLLQLTLRRLETKSTEEPGGRKSSSWMSCPIFFSHLWCGPVVLSFLEEWCKCSFFFCWLIFRFSPWNSGGKGEQRRVDFVLTTINLIEKWWLKNTTSNRLRKKIRLGSRDRHPVLRGVRARFRFAVDPLAKFRRQRVTHRSLMRMMFRRPHVSHFLNETRSPTPFFPSKIGELVSSVTYKLLGLSKLWFTV